MDKNKLRNALLVIVFILVVFGIVAITSIAAPVQFKTDSSLLALVVKWIGYIILGIFLSVLIYKLLKNRNPKSIGLANTILLISIFLLFLPRAFGRPVNGAYRWISFFGFNLQPSELVKPFVILGLSIYYYLKRNNEKDITLMSAVVIIFIGIGMYSQKSNTSTLQYILIIGLMYLMTNVSENRKRIISLIGVGGLFLGAVALKIQNGYAWKRVTEFMGDGSSQANAANFAVSLGGVKGLGIGDGLQKYYYLSEAHTDYIFSAISEETGFIGSLIIVLMFILLSLTMFYMASRINDLFRKYIAYGVAFNITNQAILHIGINLKLLPATGITLPFISYGGSSLIANMISIALLLYAFNTDKEIA